MTLQRIEIHNVKGIEHLKIEQNIIPNKPSILVAPNGFGKSSIAIAFSSLKQNRIELAEENCYKNDTSINPKIEVQFLDQSNSQHNLHADINSNTISDKFDYFVINNKLKAKGTGRNFGGYTTTSAKLALDPIQLISPIPSKVSFDYSYSDYKSMFGVNGKVLPNLSQSLNNLLLVDSVWSNVFILTRNIGTREKEKIVTFTQEVNSRSGSSENLLHWIENNKLDFIAGIRVLNELQEVISQFDLLYKYKSEYYLVALQFVWMYNKNKTGFKNACKHNSYKLEKGQYSDLVKNFNSSWKEIKPKEKRGKLIIEFPDAIQISNGQRDVLSFIVLLQKAKRKFRKTNTILIIDEVFDYLDDANLISVQYYISELISEYVSERKRFYPLILTHLNPLYFKNFVFSNQKVYFLKKANNKVKPSLVKLIKNREEPAIETEVSKYLFHYNTGVINKRSEFRTLGLKETWGEGTNFDNYIKAQRENYVNNNGEYDPFAVCCSVRKEVEKKAFEKIRDSNKRIHFLSTHTTKKKLEYAISIGINIPEVYFLLGIVYNEGMHWRENSDNESPIVNKLENITIRKIVKELFDN